MLKVLMKLNLRAMFAGFSTNKINGEYKRRGKGSYILFGLLFGYCVIAIVAMFTFLFFSLGTAFIATDYRWLYFSLVSILVFSIDFIMTIFTAKSQLFEAKDNDSLLSLPIPPRDILISRMLVILLTDFAFEILIALPAYGVWIALGQFSVSGLICFLACAIVMPLLALSCACLVGWLVSVATSRMKNSAYFTTLLSLVLFVAYMVVVMRLQSYVEGIIANGSQIAAAIKKFFYPFWCFGDAAANGNFLSTLIFILCMVLPFALVCFVLTRSFIRIVTSKRGGKSAVYREKQAKVRSVRRTMLSNEFRRLLSSSTYMLNAGLGFIFLIVGGVAALIMESRLRSLTAYLSVEVLGGIVIALLYFISSISPFTAPSVSLEGQNIYTLRSLPVSGKDVLGAKLGMHLLLMMPASLFASVCVIIALRCDALTGILLVLVPQVFTVFIALLGLLFNLALPRFDWTNETVVVKQSGSVMLSTLIGMFGGMLLVVLTALLAIPLTVSGAIAVIALPILIADIGIFCYLNKNANRIFDKLG